MPGLSTASAANNAGDFTSYRYHAARCGCGGEPASAFTAWKCLGWTKYQTASSWFHQHRSSYGVRIHSITSTRAAAAGAAAAAAPRQQQCIGDNSGGISCDAAATAAAALLRLEPGIPVVRSPSSQNCRRRSMLRARANYLTLCSSSSSRSSSSRRAAARAAAAALVEAEVPESGPVLRVWKCFTDGSTSWRTQCFHSDVSTALKKLTRQHPSRIGVQATQHSG